MVQKQERDLVTVGREAAEKSLLAMADWVLIEEALSIRLAAIARPHPTLRSAAISGCAYGRTA